MAVEYEEGNKQSDMKNIMGVFLKYSLQQSTKKFFAQL
jgi:hypothetical protein